MDEQQRSLLTKFLDLVRTTTNRLLAVSGHPPMGEWETEGPPDDEHPLQVVPPLVEDHAWEDGWYLGATRRPAHPGRWGKAITPMGRVTHTTDMLPKTFDPLVRNWTRERGRGNGAHFVLGRTKEQGLVQLMPINRNGNHAGGPTVNSKPIHGWIKINGKLTHPNVLYVGIEVHNAGRLDLVKKEWRACDRKRVNGKLILTPKGESIPAADVEIDPLHPERGWHKPTSFQFDQLAMLYRDMDPLLKPFPAGSVAVPSGEVPAWGRPPNLRDVGHISLDPERKSDPGPILMRWLHMRSQVTP